MAAVLLYVSSAFVVWMYSFIPPVRASGMRCPSSCMCLGNNVDCSNFGLINIPKDIPGWVTRLELQSNGIKEVRPDDLKGLHNLQYLDLSNNEINTLNGSIFRDLMALRILKLDSNKLTQIPLFPQPLNITELSLAHNHVVAIPLQAMQQMPELLTMDLSNNFILSITNGSFPVGSKLTHLTLNSNQISVIEQGSMNNVTFLETLRINKNKVNELPQWVFNQLHNLKTLELMRNKIRSISGLTFQGLNKLQVLKLRRNSIVNLKDGAFWGLPSLISLQMDHNKIVNVTQAWLFGLSVLKTLTLSHNRIISIDPEAWMPCKHLEKLDLTYNKLTSVTESTLAHLISLDTLLLNHNQISRIDEGAFKDLEDLNTLEMNSNHIPWTMEDSSGAFQGLTGLTKLALRANAIRSIAVHAFAGLPSLRILHLEDNNITLIQENAFETLRDLEDLRFNSSKLFCDCHLAWMASWLKHSGFQHSALGTCYHPPLLRGASIYQVDVSDFICNNAEFPKPVILESPKSANGFKGENMTLNCITAITGDSQPRILWKKDNVIMDEALSVVVASSDGDVKRYTSSLYLMDIQDSMVGRYQCVVSNEFGSAFSQRAYINVYVYPVFLKVPKDVTVKAGKPAELKCAATGQPLPVISWQKDGGDNFPAARERRMQVYPNDDRFYIMNTRPADEGVYSCMARNDAGIVITNATVTVLETPDFVQPMQGKKSSKKGETTVLQCMASGSPQPKLTWLKDDKELVMTPRHFFTVDNQILVIVDTQWSDAGMYACRMSNSLGTAKGTTELQVVSSSGDAGETGSSFGLDDESTTTGIIIIAVVCCVVGTSLVWVIIIYQTRKRHEVYSTTPTDDFSPEETILPGEGPSSGYMTSDKEGSYSQGPATVGDYHYQDYQLKESGYESSSGQFRASGYKHPPIYPTHVDEDDKPPPLTAGDRILRQIRGANSLSSLPYPASEGDTTGSRHSTSSGHHSGSSDLPSSHSDQIGHSPVNHHQQLHVVILAHEDSGRNNPPSLDSPGLKEVDHSPNLSTSQQTAGRLLFQTFHPTKPTNHDRSSSILIDESQTQTSSRFENSDRCCERQTSSRDENGDRCCERQTSSRDENGDRCCERLNRPWHCDGSCDNQSVEPACSTTNPPQSHCSACICGCSVMVGCSPASGCLHTHVDKQNSNFSSCCFHKKDGNGREGIPEDSSTDSVSFDSRHLFNDRMPPHLSLTSHSLSSSSLNSNSYSKHIPQTQSEGCKNNTINFHGGDSKENASSFPVYHFGSSSSDCSEDVTEPISSQQTTSTSLPSSQVGTSRSCCEVVKDSHQSTSNSLSCQTEQEVNDPGLNCSTCTCHHNSNHHHHHHLSHSQQQNYLTRQDTTGAISQSGSSRSVASYPTCYLHCHLCLSPVNKDYGSCGYEHEEKSMIKQPHFSHSDSCPDSQNHQSAESHPSSSSVIHNQARSLHSQDPDRMSVSRRSSSVNSVLSTTIPATAVTNHNGLQVDDDDDDNVSF